MAPMLCAPVVTTLHTPPTPWLESAIGCLPNRRANATFVSVSNANARTWRCRECIMSVIPNGILIEDWPYQATADGEHAVWSGRLVPEKGPHLAIDVARQAGRELYLAGPIGDRAYVDAEIVPRLGRDVIYMGHLDIPADPWRDHRRPEVPAGLQQPGVRAEPVRQYERIDSDDQCPELVVGEEVVHVQVERARRVGSHGPEQIEQLGGVVRGAGVEHVVR
jgi:glycosyltransferase involved in cell wall biosynthesis